MIKPQAFLFDLNGTMIDDMEYHLTAWHRILNEDLKADMTRDAVRGHMYGKNEELLDRVFGKGHFNQQQADEISMLKERRYQEAFRPHLRLIPGLDGFLKTAAAAHIKMAIGSAAIPFNIDFVLDNLSVRHYFQAIVSAADVTVSKPHPETFLKAASLLQIEPAACIVFEDAPKGVEAASHADMPCIVLTTMHTQKEFSHYTNILHFVKDYTDPVLKELFT